LYIPPLVARELKLQASGDGFSFQTSNVEQSYWTPTARSQTEKPGTTPGAKDHDTLVADQAADRSSVTGSPANQHASVVRSWGTTVPVNRETLP